MEANLAHSAYTKKNFADAVQNTLRQQGNALLQMANEIDRDAYTQALDSCTHAKVMSLSAVWANQAM